MKPLPRQTAKFQLPGGSLVPPPSHTHPPQVTSSSPLPAEFNFPSSIASYKWKHTACIPSCLSFLVCLMSAVAHSGSSSSLCSSGLYQQATPRDFPGGAVVKNPPANAGDTGSIPGLGSSHMPRTN